MSTEDIESEHCDCGDCAECCPDNYDQDGYNTHSGGEIGDKYDAFRDHLVKRGFKKLDSGSFRSTYKRGKVVVKVPRNVDGEIDNRVEDAGWHKYKSQPSEEGIFMAPCRLLPNNCLMMVAVDETACIDPDEDLEHGWVEQVEGAQVGIYRNKVVAFDYALDLGERSSWEEEWGVESDYYHYGW